MSVGFLGHMNKKIGFILAIGFLEIAVSMDVLEAHLVHQSGRIRLAHRQHSEFSRVKVIQLISQLKLPQTKLTNLMEQLGIKAPADG